MLQEEVNRGLVKPERRTHIFTLHISESCLTITTFDEEKTYPFYKFPKVKEELEKLSLLPENDEALICFLNSLAGYVFFQKTGPGGIYGTSPLPEDIYDKLWNHLIKEQPLVKEEETQTKADISELKRDSRAFLVIDFSDNPLVVFDNRDRREMKILKEELPLNLQDMVEKLKKELVIPLTTEFKKAIVAFSFRQDQILMTIFDESGMQYRSVKVDEISHSWLVRDFYTLLVDYRMPAFNRIMVRVYPYIIESVESNQIRIFKRFLSQNEKLDTSVDEIKSKLLDYNLIPRDRAYFFFTADDCGYVKKRSPHCPRDASYIEERYEISINCLSCKNELHTLFKRFFELLKEIRPESN